MKKQSSLAVPILLVHAIALLLYHCFGYFGHFGYDDLHYAQLAADFNIGSINFDDHYTYRLPVVLLTAFSYRLFGISDFASALPSILVSFSILLMVFYLLRPKGHIPLTIGLSLTLFSQWFLFYSDKLMPDIYVAFSVILSVFIIHRYKFVRQSQKPVLHAFLLALALLFGFMSKGTILLVLPLLAYLLLNDWLRGRDRRFWAYVVVMGLGLLGIYFTAIGFITGESTKRFEAIANGSYLNACSYDQQPLWVLLQRLAYGFVKMSLADGIFTAFVFILAGLFTKSIRQSLQENTAFSFFFMSAFILLLSSNFMTISPAAYVPMCLDPRHYLFMIPVAAIPAAIIIGHFVAKKTAAIPIIIGLIAAAALSFFLAEGMFWKGYLPMAVLFLVYYFLPDSFHFRLIFVIGFIGILSLPALTNLRYAQKVDYGKQQQIVSEEILQKTDNCYVITNDVQKRLGEYYQGFKTTGIQFINYEDAKNDSLDSRQKLLLLNSHTRFLASINEADLPLFARNVDPTNTLLFADSTLGMAIYTLKNWQQAEKNGTLIFESINDFEQAHPYWTQDDLMLQSEVVNDGKQSITLEEYSATFAYPVDSIADFHGQRFVITSQISCHFSAPVNADIVVSIENTDGVYFWQGHAIAKDMRAYGNWWTTKFETVISVAEIQPGSTLKVYLWNKNKTPGFMDDFVVRGYGL